MDRRVKGREDLIYFKDNPGYRRIFNGIYKKYRSLGRLGGTITLRGLTRDEKNVLSSHLRRDYSRKSSASFSVNAFVESLGHTRFNLYSLEEIL
ncbi:MAG TPA: TIGR02679 domain-containing protein, partial [Clostridia bacterium]|nr:TIGR02679 domain-containing protein [Clostridia bacterium]